MPSRHHGKSKKSGNETSINDWLLKGLAECLMFEPPIEVVKHVLLAETEETLLDYLTNLLDMKKSNCVRFVNDVVRLRNLPREKPVVFSPAHDQPPERPVPVSAVNNQKELAAPRSSGKSQPKKISLRDAGQLDTVLLPGRRSCQCLATKHDLVANCIQCGRIICEQEGPGPCMFCGNPVGDVSSQASGVTSLKDVMSSASAEQSDAQFAQALDHRNKLLEYDKTSAQRTKIYDDQSDYFTAGSAWLNEKERKALIDKQAKLYEHRFGPRRHKKIALDFAGRQIVDMAEKELDFKDFEQQETPGENMRPTMTHSQPPGFANEQDAYDNYMVNPLTVADSDYPEPKYVSASGSEQRQSSGQAGKDNQPSWSDVVQPGRLQDKEMLEMADRGVCLSVQQPYAALLVLGIKQFEGRSWATSHRGRLWIVSSSKPCSREQISSVEKFFKALYSDDNLAFPRSYPSGCLMGCVDLVDCLPQELFREKFPNGECEDEFVWVLANPKILSIQFPVTGQKPTLYRLAGHVHRAACHTLITS